MIICHCLNLTDRDIRAGMTPAAMGPCTARCGSCRNTITSMLSRFAESTTPPEK
jgi:bacterioferritin-associated ferredoxin